LLDNSILEGILIIIARVEVGCNTSTVALGAVEGEEMKHGAWGYNWVNPYLGDINTDTWSSRLGVGRKADDLACKKKTVAKYEEGKTG
jgi:hypothetical protein